MLMGMSSLSGRWEQLLRVSTSVGWALAFFVESFFGADYPSESTSGTIVRGHAEAAEACGTSGTALRRDSSICGVQVFQLSSSQ